MDLQNLWLRLKNTVVFITHGIDEAVFLADRVIVMSPRPGRITHTYELDFNKRFLECRDARAVKSSPDFIKMRETVLNIIYGDERAVNKELEVSHA